MDFLRTLDDGRDAVLVSFRASEFRAGFAGWPFFLSRNDAEEQRRARLLRAWLPYLHPLAKASFLLSLRRNKFHYYFTSFLQLGMFNNVTKETVLT